MGIKQNESIYQGAFWNCSVQLFDKETKQPILFSIGDEVVFSLKNNETDTEVLIEKIFTDFVDNRAEVFLSSEETALLVPDVYKYDIWIDFVNGDNHPIIEKSDFIVKVAIKNAV